MMLYGVILDNNLYSNYTMKCINYPGGKRVISDPRLKDKNTSQTEVENKASNSMDEYLLLKQKQWIADIEAAPTSNTYYAPWPKPKVKTNGQTFYISTTSV